MQCATFGFLGSVKNTDIDKSAGMSRLKLRYYSFVSNSNDVPSNALIHPVFFPSAPVASLIFRLAFSTSLLRNIGPSIPSKWNWIIRSLVSNSVTEIAAVTSRMFASNLGVSFGLILLANLDGEHGRSERKLSENTGLEADSQRKVYRVYENEDRISPIGLFYESPLDFHTRTTWSDT